MYCRLPSCISTDCGSKWHVSLCKTMVLQATLRLLTGNITLFSPAYKQGRNFLMCVFKKTIMKILILWKWCGVHRHEESFTRNLEFMFIGVEQVISEHIPYKQRDFSHLKGSTLRFENTGWVSSKRPRRKTCLKIQINDNVWHTCRKNTEFCGIGFLCSATDFDTCEVPVLT